mgnify:CR=1 FL=1
MSSTVMAIMEAYGIYRGRHLARPEALDTDFALHFAQAADQAVIQFRSRNLHLEFPSQPFGQSLGHLHVVTLSLIHSFI